MTSFECPEKAPYWIGEKSTTRNEPESNQHVAKPTLENAFLPNARYWYDTKPTNREVFSLIKRKRHDPEAIATAVLRAASDPRIIAGFLKEFASSQQQSPRVILGVIVYAYCWAKMWAVKRTDARVSDAYSGAAEIIASRFQNAARLVPVSNYVVSELEMATFSLEFCDYLRQHVPLELDVYPDIMAEMKAHDEAVRSHQVRFETLIKMVMLIRAKRMTEELSSCVPAHMNEESTIVTLADTLYEQISGVGPLDLAQDFILWHEWDLARPRRMEAVLSLMSRLDIELEPL